jgi:hypothetical protein
MNFATFLGYAAILIALQVVLYHFAAITDHYTISGSFSKPNETIADADIIGDAPDVNNGPCSRHYTSNMRKQLDCYGNSIQAYNSAVDSAGELEYRKTSGFRGFDWSGRCGPMTHAHSPDHAEKTK